MFYVCKGTTLLRYHQIFSQKSYQKVLVLTFIYINKVIFYRFSQYISNTQILSKYYFILRAIIIYIIYLIIYRENKRCASWVVPVAYSSRSRQAEPARTPQCGGAVILVNLSPRDRNSKCNALNINYFISPFGICRATRNCRRGGNYAREMIYNHLKHK